MAASSKFELSSSSSDGPPAHPSGQRVAVSLERPGSFREAAENRIGPSLASSSSSRAGSMSTGQGDAASLLQSVVSDMKAVVGFDQKFSRPGEVTRSVGSILGISQEDSLPASFTMRSLSSSSVEEIRRFRNNIQDNSAKASDRAKAFGDAALKIDKFYSNLSRKRSRTDISSSGRSNAAAIGGSTPKMGPQGHLSAGSLEIGPQKSEERAKNGAPSRKIRTSLLEMDARPSSIARPSGSMDRERDVFNFASSATPPEEKGRPLQTPGEWDKSKMKKKRSVLKSDASGNTVLVRPHDCDRELKRGMQQKLITEARPRVYNAHGFRSGPAIGITGVGKLDSASQPIGIGVRPFPRNDQDNDSLPNDRRDHVVGSDKEGVTPRNASKPNGREESYTGTGSPTSTVKMNTSIRGPRSNSGSLSKTASLTTNRALGNSDDWEHENSMNKLNSVVGAVNRKRSSSQRTSPPPNWVGQRNQKSRAARRSNLPPVVSNRDDFPASDVQATMAVNDDGLGFTRRPPTNASQQSKSRGDQVVTAGLSESEDSGVVDNKVRDKSRKSSDMEEKVGASTQKVATLVLPSRKSKVIAEEDQEDGIQRHGKISRGTTPTRSSMPVSNEKLDSVATAKQMRSARINYDKTESKPGRPLTKKWSERKGHTRPRHSATGPPSEYAGESDDDHEELVAAANAAMTTGVIWDCPKKLEDGSTDGKEDLVRFWKENGNIFSFLTAEDQEFLKQQLRLSDVAEASVCRSGDGQSLKGDFEHTSMPSTPTLSSRCGHEGSPNGTISLNERMRVIEPANQSNHVEPFLEDLMPGNGAQVGVSICQALLSAIIEEEEIESFNHRSNNEEDHLYGNAYGIHFGIDAELKSKSSNLQPFGTFQATDKAAFYSYKANTSWGYHDELTQDLGSNGVLDEFVPNLTVSSNQLCTEFQYSQMGISNRILLELSEIGVYPEPVPCLVQSEDEDISEGINRLTAKLHEQVLKKKSMLLELEKAVVEARVSQQRTLERIALDRLVGMAYDKYRACWGANASGSKNMNRANKQATLAFVRRTLARYRRFEETGTSCFSEPVFQDMFASVSSQNDASANVVDPFTSGRQSNMSLADRDHGLASQPAQREDIHNKYSDAFRSVNRLTEQTCGREDQWSNKLKKKELLLDEVVGSATAVLRAASGVGGSLVSSTKGKRSERDREGKGQSRDSASRNGTAKIGRPGVSNVKGERKNKSKPKQKTTQLSASVNGLHGKATEMPSAPESRDNVGGGTKKDGAGAHSSYSGAHDMPNDAEAIDFSNLQLPEIDVDGFGGQGHDIASWLDIEEDGLQDHDFMGLEIPMDDLSELNVMF